jgi:hypothetical protein
LHFTPQFIPSIIVRLAFDIAFAREELDDVQTGPSHTKQYYYPFQVEAVDSSITMASAAHHILHISASAFDNDHVCEPKQYNDENLFNNATRCQRTIYPFASDPFSNEVNTEKRWESASFPEVEVFKQHPLMQKTMFLNAPDLSYTIGDFVTTYASKAKHEMYGSIATCFFIDTATNIYEYILIIKNLLRRRGHDSTSKENSNNVTGGLWINLGPVQWHRNAQLQPSVNELRQVIELAGFEIHHWEVEDTIGYRHPDEVSNSDSDKPRFTRSEGYRPLKFVASLQHEGTDKASSSDLLPLMEKLRLITGRKSMFSQTRVDGNEHNND